MDSWNRRGYPGGVLPEICVVHLVWAPLGIGPFSTFITSYRQNKGDIDHDLLVVFNGFHGKDELDEYHAFLDGVIYHSLFLPQPVRDIAAYLLTAARCFEYEYFCFLNSYSVILDRNWLVKMYKYVQQKNVGLVGATGSCESLYTTVQRRADTSRKGSLYKRIIRKYRRKRLLRKYQSYFDPFPNPHIRTTAFMISKSVIQKIKFKSIRTRVDALRFESGKNSLTRQVLKMGLEVLIVGKDGKGYEKGEWYKSNTFRQGDQGNLLVADNRTNSYLEGDYLHRKEQSEAAWGDKAKIM